MHPYELALPLANLREMTLSVQPLQIHVRPATEILPSEIFQQLTQATQTPQSDFRPASEVPTEVLPATPFVFIAYAFVWVALLGYLFSLWRKLARVERELTQVVSRVEGQRR